MLHTLLSSLGLELQFLSGVPSDLILSLLAFIALGSLLGLIAGTFGVGGGIILVPVFLWSFSALSGEVSEQIIWQRVVATSHASIFFTSLSSAFAHHQRQNVNFTTLKQMTPGIIIGALFIGTWLIAVAPMVLLKGFFTLFILILALRYLFGRESKESHPLAGWPGYRTAGWVIGTLASLIGIGGGSLIVPFAKWRGEEIKRAIGTSSACGVPIAFASALGLIIAGWHSGSLKEGYLGFVYLPAFAGISIASAVTTRWGAYIAHRLPSHLLTRLFGGLLLLITFSMGSQIVRDLLSSL